MLKDYEIDKPVLETDRLIIRPLTEADVQDLKKWFLSIVTTAFTVCLEKIM